MKTKIGRWTSALFLVPLALAGCMKSGEDATGSRPEGTQILDADHGGARIILPEIDPAALGKAGADSGNPDSGAKGWFELSITGENMPAMNYRFPLTNKPGGQGYDIKGIPAGMKRSFHGSLVNSNHVVTHEGVTVADIRGGEYTDVRLFLAKATGSAQVCVVIEGQKLPPCAGDTLPPPPPVPDSGKGGGCWSLSSAWVTGKVKLYDSVVNGSMGELLRDSGAALPFTTWSRQGDTLMAILVAPNLQEKWLFRGVILGSGSVWEGTLSVYATGKSTSFVGKTLPCSMVIDPGPVPPDTLPPPPANVGAIPLPGSGAKETTLCFEMRFDYGTNSCELQGYAKMDFKDGLIPFGNMTVADKPAREYMSIIGKYDVSAISFYGVTAASGTLPRDTLSLQGFISASRTMAKGEYLRLPSGKKGNWTMSLVQCGSWTPAYPDSSCFAAAK